MSDDENFRNIVGRTYSEAEVTMGQEAYQAHIALEYAQVEYTKTQTEMLAGQKEHAVRAMKASAAKDSGLAALYSSLSMFVMAAMSVGLVLAVIGLVALCQSVF